MTVNNPNPLPIPAISVLGWNTTPPESINPGASGTVVDMWINAPGTNVYLCEDSSDTIDQWSMSPGWDFSTLTAVSAWSMPAAVNRPFGMVVTPDEDFVIIADITNHAVTSRAILTPGDITSTTDTVTTSVSTVGVTSDSDINGMVWADEGRKLYFINNQGFGYWPLSTPYDFSTTGTSVYFNVVTAGSPRIDNFEGGGSDLQVSDNGLRIYILRTSSPWEIKEWDLSTQWEPDSAVLNLAKFTADAGPDGNQGFVIRLAEGEIWTHSTDTDDFYLYTRSGDPQ